MNNNNILNIIDDIDDLIVESELEMMSNLSEYYIKLDMMNDSISDASFINEFMIFQESEERRERKKIEIDEDSIPGKLLNAGKKALEVISKMLLKLWDILLIVGSKLFDVLSWPVRKIIEMVKKKKQDKAKEECKGIKATSKEAIKILKDLASGEDIDKEKVKVIADKTVAVGTVVAGFVGGVYNDINKTIKSADNKDEANKELNAKEKFVQTAMDVVNVAANQIESVVKNNVGVSTSDEKEQIKNNLDEAKGKLANDFSKNFPEVVESGKNAVKKINNNKAVQQVKGVFDQLGDVLYKQVGPLLDKVENNKKEKELEKLRQAIETTTDQKRKQELKEDYDNLNKHGRSDVIKSIARILGKMYNEIDKACEEYENKINELEEKFDPNSSQMMWEIEDELNSLYLKVAQSEKYSKYNIGEDRRVFNLSDADSIKHDKSTDKIQVRIIELTQAIYLMREIRYYLVSVDKGTIGIDVACTILEETSKRYQSYAEDRGYRRLKNGVDYVEIDDNSYYQYENIKAIMNAVKADRTKVEELLNKMLTRIKENDKVTNKENLENLDRLKTVINKISKEISGLLNKTQQKIKIIVHVLNWYIRNDNK